VVLKIGLSIFDDHILSIKSTRPIQFLHKIAPYFLPWKKVVKMFPTDHGISNFLSTASFRNELAKKKMRTNFNT